MAKKPVAPNLADVVNSPEYKGMSDSVKQQIENALLESRGKPPLPKTGKKAISAEEVLANPAMVKAIKEKIGEEAAEDFIKKADEKSKIDDTDKPIVVDKQNKVRKVKQKTRKQQELEQQENTQRSLKDIILGKGSRAFNKMFPMLGALMGGVYRGGDRSANNNTTTQTNTSSNASGTTAILSSIVDSQKTSVDILQQILAAIKASPGTTPSQSRQNQTPPPPASNQNQTPPPQASNQNQRSQSGQNQTTPPPASRTTTAPAPRQGAQMNLGTAAATVAGGAAIAGAGYAAQQAISGAGRNATAEPIREESGTYNRRDGLTTTSVVYSNSGGKYLIDNREVDRETYSNFKQLIRRPELDPRYLQYLQEARRVATRDDFLPPETVAAERLRDVRYQEVDELLQRVRRLPMAAITPPATPSTPTPPTPPTPQPPPAAAPGTEYDITTGMPIGAPAPSPVQQTRPSTAVVRTNRQGNFTFRGVSIPFSAQNGVYTIGPREVNEATFNEFLRLKDTTPLHMAGDFDGLRKRDVDTAKFLDEVMSGRRTIQSQQQPAPAATQLAVTESRSSAPSATPVATPAAAPGTEYDMMTGMPIGAPAATRVQTPAPVSSTPAATPRASGHVHTEAEINHLKSIVSRSLGPNKREHVDEVVEQLLTLPFPFFRGQPLPRSNFVIGSIVRDYINSRPELRDPAMGQAIQRLDAGGREAYRMVEEQQQSAPATPISATPTTSTNTTTSAPMGGGIRMGREISESSRVAAPSPTATTPATTARDFGREYGTATEARAKAEQELASFRERAGPTSQRPSRYEDPELQTQYEALQRRTTETQAQEKRIQEQNQSSALGLPNNVRFQEEVSTGRGEGRGAAAVYNRMLETLKSRFNYTDEQISQLSDRNEFGFGTIGYKGRRISAHAIRSLFERHMNEDLVRSAHDSALQDQSDAAAVPNATPVAAPSPTATTPTTTPATPVTQVRSTENVNLQTFREKDPEGFQEFTEFVRNRQREIVREEIQKIPANVDPVSASMYRTSIESQARSIAQQEGIERFKDRLNATGARTSQTSINGNLITRPGDATPTTSTNTTTSAPMGGGIRMGREISESSRISTPAQTQTQGAAIEAQYKSSEDATPTKSASQEAEEEDLRENRILNFKADEIFFKADKFEFEGGEEDTQDASKTTSNGAGGGSGGGGDATPAPPAPNTASAGGGSGSAGSGANSPAAASGGNTGGGGSTTGGGADATPAPTGASGDTGGEGINGATSGGDTTTTGDAAQALNPAATAGLNFAPGVDQRIKPGIADKVKDVQSGFGKGLSITSGYRDPARNARVGGASGSKHLTGDAVDIKFAGNQEDTINFIKAASAKGLGGIGVYGPGFVHIDTGAKRVWGPDYRAGSIPAWAKAALNDHMTGQTTATPAGSSPTSGAAVAEASAQNDMSTRVSTPGPSVQPSNSGSTNPVARSESSSNPIDPNNPGPLEPTDAGLRYARLFSMAA